MSTLDIPAACLHSKMRNTGYCWFSCNRIEVEASKAISRWRCAVCVGNLPPTHTGGSTCKINRYLDVSHGNNKDNPIGAATMPAHSTLHMAFAKAIHILQFDRDLFKALLIQWIPTNNIGFCVVEQCTFRLRLSYLMACLSFIQLYNFSHCHMG